MSNPNPHDLVILWDLENLQGVLKYLLFTHLTSHGKIRLQPTKFSKMELLKLKAVSHELTTELNSAQKLREN